MDFSAQLIVVTGVGRKGQLGEALGAAFGKAGATVAVVDRLADEARARADELHAAGFRASWHEADLTDERASRALVEGVAAAHPQFDGRVNAVICAAGGYAGSAPLDAMETADWQRMFAINLQTALETTRAFLPAVRKAQGSFVYFTSVAALPAGSPKGMAAYAAAKSAVLSLMRSVAADERKNHVRANAIAPTAIRTAANIDAMGADKDYVDRESVADVTLFLASQHARNVSGQVITLA